MNFINLFLVKKLENYSIYHLPILLTVFSRILWNHENYVQLKYQDKLNTCEVHLQASLQMFCSNFGIPNGDYPINFTIYEKLTKKYWKKTKFNGVEVMIHPMNNNVFQHTVISRFYWRSWSQQTFSGQWFQPKSMYFINFYIFS